MAKKIWYSQPLSVMWEAYNKSNKDGKLSPKEFIWKWMTPQIRNPFLPDGSQVQANILVSDMFYADTRKEFLHLYFVDKSLRDFLKDLPIKDFDGLMQTIFEKGIDIEGSAISNFGQVIRTGDMGKNFEFGIHIPYENKHKGYAFKFIYDPKNKKLIFTWLVGQNPGYITVEQYKELIADKSESAKQAVEFFQLAVNTIIYMNTFPDCVVDGAPHNVKEEYSRKIEVAEKVADIMRDSDSTRTVSPHSRRAYFKRLTSDFYTHKKGQTILVRETMVNGKAKTIYTATNLERMADDFSKLE